MLLAALHAVEKVYGEQVVLQDATLELRDGDRVALIGRNGSGKSTLLKLLVGNEKPDAGRIFLAEDATMAYLEQDPRFQEADTVVGVATSAFAELDALQLQLESLEAAGLDDPQRFHRWEQLHAVFERRGGYARRARRDAVLSALGFAQRHDQPVSQLSGGERTRLGLAQLLMAQPDVLLLDEPTNHLDIEMRNWLEGHLARYPGAALIVSHDRAFLDGAASRTAEVSRGQLRHGPGNPSAYRAAREEAERQQAAQRSSQEKELERLQDATEQMRRWAAKNSQLFRRAKAMQRRVDRYQAGMTDEVQRAERTTRFSFEADESGDIVLTGEHLSKSFGGRALFRDVTFELRQGDRVGLVGRNGEGKSTLLKMIVGQLASDDPRGQVRTGARVRLGYYDQELKGMDGDNTLFEELLKRMGDVEAHNALGRFLFPYEAQFKKIADLSGGERARLALLNLTLGRYNLLVLDEPTNHLDVEMITALEESLQEYQGTLLFVSHDRRFLSALADSVWEVKEGALTRYGGDWNYYLRHRTAAQPATEPGQTGPPTAASAAAPEKRGPSRWQLERRLEDLESQITEAERALEQLGDQLAAPDDLRPDELQRLLGVPMQPQDGPPLTQAEKLALLGARHATLEAELLKLMEEWHDISERLAAA